MRWLSLRKWRLRELLASWIAYWIVLVGVMLGPAIAAVWRATHAGSEHGDVTVSFGKWNWALTVKLAGKPIYTGTASFLTIALLVAGPPLLVWLLWVSRRPSPEPVLTEPR